MPYAIEYFNSRVLAQIEGWPVGILADYARLAELLIELDQIRGCHIHARSEADCSSCARPAL